MVYEEAIKRVTLDTLQDRVSSVCDCIVALLDAGFVPNKNKTTILNWSSILIHAYGNIDIFTKEQQDKIDTIYNKIMNL